MSIEKDNSLTILFMHLGIAISLIVVVVSSFTTAFSMIDYWLPSDSLHWHRYQFMFGKLSGSVSFLVVSFSVLLYLSGRVRCLMGKVSKSDREKVWYKVYNAVVLLVLTLSFLAVGISVALLLGGILRGDLTLAYLYKLLFVLIVGGLVFVYYRGVLHDTWQRCRVTERLLVGLTVFLVTVMVIMSLCVLDPVNRKALDETYRTLSILHAVASDLNLHYTENNNLPERLEDINSLPNKGLNRMHNNWQSEINKEFIYAHRLGSLYELCANFAALPTEKAKSIQDYPYNEHFPVEHLGENCFQLDATTVINPNDRHYLMGYPG